MRVLSFDPGYERLGVAIIEGTTGKETLLHSDCLRTNAADSFQARLLSLGASVQGLCDSFSPDSCALETLFFQKNQKTAMQVAEVRGMLLYIAMTNNLEIYEYSPQEVKIAITGNGRADKKAMLAMIPQLISFPKKPMLDDELDAIGVGLTALACAPSTRKGC